MTTLSIELPDDVFSTLRRAPDEVIKEMRIAAATEWYKEERITQGKGAEIAGLTRAAFIDELARRKIPVCQVHTDELWKELHG